MNENKTKQSELSQYITDCYSYDSASGIITCIKNRKKTYIGLAVGHIDKNGYMHICIRKKQMQYHRVAWFLCYGKWPDKDIDHINGIKTDNRMENLREVSMRENQQNLPKHRKGKLCGASFKKQYNKWESKIFVNGKYKGLGMFNTEKEAHEKYQRFLREEFNGY